MILKNHSVFHIMEPTQVQSHVTPSTIPGVRVLFNNTQTFDLPLISTLDEVAPSFEAVISQFSSEAWLHFANAGVAFQTSTVLAIVKIDIPVSNNVDAQADAQPDAQSPEIPAEAVFPVG